MSFSASQFQIAVVVMMALFTIVLGYETIAQALANLRERNPR